MITRWQLANFKSIQEQTEVELAPLTLFAGGNSSGKSTLLQSILLIGQTLNHKVGSRAIVLNGSLASLGQFDDLRSRSSQDPAIRIGWSLRPGARPYRASEPTRDPREMGGALLEELEGPQLREIRCEISFHADPSSADRDLLQIQPRLQRTELSCVTDGPPPAWLRLWGAPPDGTPGGGAPRPADAPHHDHDLEGSASAGGYRVEMDPGSLAEIQEEFSSAAPVGCQLRYFLPERVIFSLDRTLEDARTVTRTLQSEHLLSRSGSEALGRRLRTHRALPPEVLEVLTQVLERALLSSEPMEGDPVERQPWPDPGRSTTLQAWVERLQERPPEVRSRVRRAFVECDDLLERILEALERSEGHLEGAARFARVPLAPPRGIQEAARYLDDFFSFSFKYLGPLREAPRPLYPLAASAGADDVGLQGEHTASVLDLHKHRRVSYLPSACFSRPGVEWRPVVVPLEEAVADWLLYLDVASSVLSRDRGKLGHELKVEVGGSGAALDLTHVGVGVSQVLPILVMGLLCEPDSTLLFEQPELHLHPKVQTLLGDFFLSLALSGKQCLVETHSEYMVDRLRFRIASASAGQGMEGLTRIYFVEKDGPQSRFREVVINEYGAILDWPEGFFDQSQRQAEEILRAAARKRSARRGAGR